MTNKKVWVIDEKNEISQIENINKAILEKYDYIAIINPIRLKSDFNRLKNIISKYKIPSIIYTDQTSEHNNEIKELMGSASYVITGLKDILTEGGSDNFTSNFNKMINETLDKK